jgi:hypothetical protein
LSSRRDGRRSAATPERLCVRHSGDRSAAAWRRRPAGARRGVRARYPDIIAIVITGSAPCAKPSRSRGSAPKDSSPSRFNSRSCCTS